MQDPVPCRLEDFTVGMTANFVKTVSREDVLQFAEICGDHNSVHVNEEFASKTRFGRCIAHGILSASLISTVLGTKLPGPGSIYAGQTLRFTNPVYIGDTVTATATITEIIPEKRRIVLKTECHVGDTMVVTGEAQIWVPPTEQA